MGQAKFWKYRRGEPDHSGAWGESYNLSKRLRDEWLWRNKKNPVVMPSLKVSAPHTRIWLAKLRASFLSQQNCKLVGFLDDFL